MPTVVFWEIPKNRRIRELEFMVPEFVARTGGSKWVSALPTGSKWLSALPTGSKWVQAQPAPLRQIGEQRAEAEQWFRG